MPALTELEKQTPPVPPTPSETEAPEHCAASSYSSGKRVSYALLAVLLLIAMDTVARLWFRSDPYASANRSWVYWAVKDLRQNQTAPDLVILGSSLMLAAENDGDATVFHQQLDAVLHHRSLYFEQLLSKGAGHPVKTASLAIGGQMASDVAAYCRTVLKGQYQPRAIVWGIAPRDFADSTFLDPESSETVRYLNHVMQRDVLATKPRFWTAFERSLGNLSYLYGNRFQYLAGPVETARLVLSSLSTSPESTPQELRKIVRNPGDDDNAVRQWLVTPYAPTVGFADNSAEYKQRYVPFKPKLFQMQLHYFEEALQLWQSEGVRVILVNMPLTQSNLKLLPAGVYDKYLNNVKTLCSKYGADLVDFNQPGLFPPSEFADAVHLNGMGGMRFWQMLSRRDWSFLKQ